MRSVLRFAIFVTTASFLCSCSTIIPYDKSAVVETVEVTFKPPGGKIINTLGDQALIKSNNKMEIKRIIWSGMQFYFPIPIPYRWGSANGGVEYDMPRGLIAQWPSGATAPIEMKPGYLFYHHNHPSYFTFEANHPDERFSVRYQYDEWIYYKGICSQSVTFIVSPQCLEYSIDHSPFIPADSGLIRHEWAFNYDEHDRGYKDVLVVFKWPSGVTNALLRVPINSTRRFSRSSAPLTETVNVYHPLPNSTQYTYDSLEEHRRKSYITPRAASISRPIQNNFAMPESSKQLYHEAKTPVIDNNDYGREYINMQQDLNRQLIENQKRAIAEMERSNRAREEQLSREGMRNSVQMLNHSLQNIGDIYQRSSPPTKSTYEIKPAVIDLIPNDGIMDAGSFGNPYIIEGK